MEIGSWLISYILSALFWLWVLKLGGTDWLVGWKAWGIIGWFSGHWNVEQVRFYALILLIFETVWFLARIIYPGARFV
ncbi:MAG: hypothetical protein L3J98_14905 [Gammaproteobacteria bacterium]|nr:hypothetical protein [Gammaproteobacteria bacterium]